MAFGKGGFEKLEHERCQKGARRKRLQNRMAKWVHDWLRKVDEERQKIENLQKRYKERERTRTINHVDSFNLLGALI